MSMSTVIPSLYTTAETVPENMGHRPSNGFQPLPTQKAITSRTRQKNRKMKQPQTKAYNHFPNSSRYFIAFQNSRTTCTGA